MKSSASLRVFQRHRFRQSLIREKMLRIPRKHRYEDVDTSRFENKGERLSVADVDLLRLKKSNLKFNLDDEQRQSFDQTWTLLCKVLNLNLAKNYLEEYYGLTGGGLYLSKKLRNQKDALTQLSQLIALLWRRDEVARKSLLEFAKYSERIPLSSEKCLIPNRLYTYACSKNRMTQFNVESEFIEATGPVWQVQDAKRRVLEYACQRLGVPTAVAWVVPSRADSQYLAQPLPTEALSSMFPSDWGHWRLRSSPAEVDFDMAPHRTGEAEAMQLASSHRGFDRNSASALVYLPSNEVAFVEWEKAEEKLVAGVCDIKKEGLAVTAELGYVVYESPLEELGVSYTNPLRWPKNQQPGGLVENAEPMIANLAMSPPLGNMTLVGKPPSPHYLVETQLPEHSDYRESFIELLLTDLSASDAGYQTLHLKLVRPHAVMGERVPLELKNATLKAKLKRTLVGSPNSKCDGAVEIVDMLNLSKGAHADIMKQLKPVFANDKIYLQDDKVTLRRIAGCGTFSLYNSTLVSRQCYRLNARLEDYRLESKRPSASESDTGSDGGGMVTLDVFVDTALRLDHQTRECADAIERLKVERGITSDSRVNLESTYSRVYLECVDVASGSLSSTFVKILNSILYLTRQL